MAPPIAELRLHPLAFFVALPFLGSCQGEAAGESVASNTAYLIARSDEIGLRRHPVVVLGIEHGCVLDDLGSVRCWGSNVYEQLGYASSWKLHERGLTDALPLSSTPNSIVAGAWHTCALLDGKEKKRAGKITCWGRNDSGQIGEWAPYRVKGPVTRELNELLELDANGEPIAPVLAGGPFYSCMAINGHVSCWGSDAASASVVAWNISNFGKARSVVTGRDHACALVEDGAVWCWGNNASDQRGLATAGRTYRWKTEEKQIPYWQPTKAALREPAVEIAAGLYHTCARLRTSEVTCWGSDAMGQRGVERRKFDYESTIEPIAIDFRRVDRPQKVVAGSHHSCALFPQEIICWGRNDDGQLGYQSAPVESLGSVQSEMPGAAVDLAKIGAEGRKLKDVFAGGSTSCATFEDGAIACWGALPL